MSRQGSFRARAEGSGFEGAFKTRAQLEGLRCLKLPECGKWIGNGMFKPIPGLCDFMLLDSAGRAAFVDTKSVDSVTFPYSAINQDQVSFFESVGDLCTAGYVIFFRPSHRIIMVPWTKLKTIGPKESIILQDGYSLGDELNFSPRRIYTCK